MSGEIKVKTVYSDPIDGFVMLRQDGVVDAVNKMNFVDIDESLANKFNPLIGYYGYTRRYNDGSLKFHTGFDYSAPVGTIVKAVHTGGCNWVRIGTPKEKKQEKCILRKIIIQNKKNEFNASACQECKSALKGNCYGAQLWLHWKEGNSKRWAFYAHLSKFSDKVWNAIKDSVNQNIVDYNPSCSFNIDETVGFSGCTGNAYEMNDYQEHLHFECLDNNLKKQNPNAIVKTKFEIVNDLVDLDLDRKELRKYIGLFLNDSISTNDLRLLLLHFDKKKENYIIQQK